MIDTRNDHYALFGLERRLELDPSELQRRFLALSRERHPDLHGGAADGARDEIQRRSARVNDAYRTLRDPVARAEYLLSLAGIERPEGAAKCPPDLLEEVFSLREAMMEGGGPETVDRARRLFADADAAFAGLRLEHDAETDAGTRRGILEEVRTALDRRKFLANIVREIRESLEPRV